MSKTNIVEQIRYSFQPLAEGFAKWTRLKLPTKSNYESIQVATKIIDKYQFYSDHKWEKGHLIKGISCEKTPTITPTHYSSPVDFRDYYSQFSPETSENAMIQGRQKPSFLLEFSALFAIVVSSGYYLTNINFLQIINELQQDTAPLNPAEHFDYLANQVFQLLRLLKVVIAAGAGLGLIESVKFLTAEEKKPNELVHNLIKGFSYNFAKNSIVLSAFALLGHVLDEISIISQHYGEGTQELFLANGEIEIYLLYAMIAYYLINLLISSTNQISQGRVAKSLGEVFPLSKFLFPNS